MKIIDITGQVFGRYTVLERSPSARKSQAKWVCACECGSIKIVAGYDLRNGLSKSCGCLRDERTALINKKHGMTRTKEYRAWRNMLNRCFYTKAPDFRRYGGAGISVCDEWKNSFESFIKDMGKCPSGYSIDRIDVFGNYTKDNCRWASDKTQRLNKKGSLIATIDGITKPVQEWCSELGVNYRMVRARITDYGWDPQRAILTKKHSKAI